MGPSRLVVVVALVATAVISAVAAHLWLAAPVARAVTPTTAAPSPPATASPAASPSTWAVGLLGRRAAQPPGIAIGIGEQAETIDTLDEHGVRLLGSRAARWQHLIGRGPDASAALLTDGETVFDIDRVAVAAIPLATADTFGAIVATCPDQLTIEDVMLDESTPVLQCSDGRFYTRDGQLPFVKRGHEDFVYSVKADGHVLLSGTIVARDGRRQPIDGDLDTVRAIDGGWLLAQMTRNADGTPRSVLLEALSVAGERSRLDDVAWPQLPHLTVDAFSLGRDGGLYFTAQQQDCFSKDTCSVHIVRVRQGSTTTVRRLGPPLPRHFTIRAASLKR